MYKSNIITTILRSIHIILGWAENKRCFLYYFLRKKSPLLIFKSLVKHPVNQGEPNDSTTF